LRNEVYYWRFLELFGFFNRNGYGGRIVALGGFYNWEVRMMFEGY
jgi:hypothetical protein